MPTCIGTIAVGRIRLMTALASLHDMPLAALAGLARWCRGLCRRAT
jgi:hypothetical protein